MAFTTRTLTGTHPEGGVVIGEYLYIINYTGNTLDKIHLRNFGLVSSLTLSKTVPETITTDGTSLFIGTMNSPGEVIKVNPDTMARVGSVLTLEAGENALAGMHIVGTDLYCGCWVAPGKVVKVDISSGLSRTGVITFESGEDKVEEMDDDGTYLYCPTEDGDDVVRVTLSNFTREGAIALPANVEEPQVCFVNGDYCYIVTRAGSANVGLCRFPLADFTAGAIETVVFSSGRSCAIVSDDTYFYIFKDESSATKTVTRVLLSDFTKVDNLSLTGSTTTDGPEVIAKKGRFIYVCDNDEVWILPIEDRFWPDYSA